MSTRLQPNLVEAALLSLLSTNLTGSYGQRVNCAVIDKGDFDDDGQLILVSPMVRIRFNSGAFGATRDTQKTTLNGELLFSFPCYHESLKSKGDQRTKTFELLAVVTDELAGARLQLTPGVYTEPLLLVSIDQVIDTLGPVDQCYAPTFMVPGIAQFSGKNANFGARA